VDGIAMITDSDVWIGATRDCCGGAYFDYLAHWNGAVWKPTQSVLPYDINNRISDISAVSVSDVWAAGIGAGEARAEHYSCTSNN
jgi:hypothetical protein